ncbi:MAG: DUF4249 family protein [Bacteroidota bacterium]
MEAELKSIIRYCSVLFSMGTMMVSSCQEIEADDSTQVKPVVQGYIASGHTVEVDVKTQLLFASADTSVAVSGLHLLLSVDGKQYPLTQFDTVYRSPVVVQEGKVYTLEFDYNGKTISSTTTIPEPPSGFTASDSLLVITPFNSQGFGFPVFPNPITLTWNNPDESNYLIVVKNIETNPAAINAGATRRFFVFRSNPVQNNTFDIRAMQFQYYGRHHIILYKINGEYAELYQNNGTSSLNIKTPYSNVTNGLGIFTGINADTLMVRVKPR